MSVSATLLYANLPEDGSRPYSAIDQSYELEALLGPIPFDKRNYGFSKHTAQIKQVPSDDFASLDKTGFQFVHAPTSQKVFEDDEDKLAAYYTESIEIIKKVTGANRAVVFDHVRTGHHRLSYSPLTMAYRPSAGISRATSRTRGPRTAIRSVHTR